jgi:hypothetical protein
MGAYGSANGGLFEYIEPPLLGTLPAANDRPKTLPVFYRYQAAINTLQAVPSNLILTVTSTNDSGAGSLRAVIGAANASLHYNRIVFAVPGAITLLSDLPVVKVPLSIDGTTAPGWAPGSPAVEIDAAGHQGIFLAATASGSDSRAWHSPARSGSDSKAGRPRSVLRKTALEFPFRVCLPPTAWDRLHWPPVTMALRAFPDGARP